MGALQHGAARTVLDNRVRLSVRAKNRLDRTVADDGMHAIGSRDYVAVSEVNAIVIPGSDDGKRIRRAVLPPARHPELSGLLS